MVREKKSLSEIFGCFFFVTKKKTEAEGLKNRKRRRKERQKMIIATCVIFREGVGRGWLLCFCLVLVEVALFPLLAPTTTYYSSRN